MWDKIALVTAVIALLVGGVGYWRSGGERDVEVAGTKLAETVDKLQAKQKELVDDAVAAIESAYARSREQLDQFGDRIAEARDEASEALTKQLDRAAEQVAALKESLAEGVRDVKEGTVRAARETQEAIAKRVNRMDARISILQAQWRVGSAVKRAEEEDLVGAHERLEQALSLVKEARTTLGEDRAYEEQIKSLRAALLAAVEAVKSKAEAVKARLDHVVTSTDTLVAELETDEQTAANLE